MGNREDLLEGAKRCLFEKGYARTTARDIATASGVSLAAIGYHFGSKEALLHQAYDAAMDDFGQQIGRSMAEIDPSASPPDRFVAVWDKVIELYPTYGKAWIASIEMVAHMDDEPKGREQLSGSLQEGRQGLAQMFGFDENDAKVGSFLQAMMSGVLVQWLVDPTRAPSGKDLAEALQAVAAGWTAIGKAAQGKPGGKAAQESPGGKTASEKPGGRAAAPKGAAASKAKKPSAR